MSPDAQITVSAGWGFPRVSGDEPILTLGRDEPLAFSPRERG